MKRLICSILITSKALGSAFIPIQKPSDMNGSSTALVLKPRCTITPPSDIIPILTISHIPLTMNIYLPFYAPIEGVESIFARRFMFIWTQGYGSSGLNFRKLNPLTYEEMVQEVWEYAKVDPSNRGNQICKPN